MVLISDLGHLCLLLFPFLILLCLICLLIPLQQKYLLLVAFLQIICGTYKVYLYQICYKTCSAKTDM